VNKSGCVSWPVSDRSSSKCAFASLEFLTRMYSSVSAGNCSSFLDPIIDSWISTEDLWHGVVLNRLFAAGSLKRFEFAEQGLRPWR